VTDVPDLLWEDRENFVYAMAAEYAGNTLLGLCAFLGRRFIETYPVMEALRVSASEVPLDAAAGERGPSDVLFRSARADRAVAEVAVDVVDGKPHVTAARSGWEGIALVKTTGSSFAQFARDQYTSLPDLVDRPLTIRLDAYWRYGDPQLGSRISSGLIRRALEQTFHEFDSRSIQHLVHVMGTRLLKGFPVLSEVEFAAENHTPDAVAEGKGDVRVFAEPRQTFGKIGLVLRR